MRVDAEEGVQRQGFKTDVSSIVAFVAENVSVFPLVPLATSISALAIETSLAPRANPSALNSILFPLISAFTIITCICMHALLY